ncbi:BILBO1 [Trypanosoma melophagium]|uniref:BILBO1 n=1 Tax=Trypanosoma melophagium TaxID=715481 RepID=UPI00351A00C5|nr:BILBO1 [Trypanosoma melophagium]
MQYSICVATDVDGEKVNLRFLFDAYGPSVTQLLNRAAVAFNNLFHRCGIPRAFATSAAVVFNETQCTWDRLERSTQLLHNSQVYLFQPDILDLPAVIPEPYEAQPLLGDTYVSPRREASDSPRAVGPTHYEPRPAFIHPSPGGPPQHGDNRKKGSVYKTAAATGVIVGGKNRYNKPLSDERDFMVDNNSVHAMSFSTPKRGNNGTLVGSSRTILRGREYDSFSVSPLVRQPTEESYVIYSDGRKSILRDEREKIEKQWRLPLDEMRRSLKEETRELERSISPVRIPLL